MNTSVIKLLSAFFNAINLGNVIFLPLGIRVTSMNLADYLSDAEIKAFFYNKSLVKTIDNLEIKGMPTNDQLRSFVNTAEARVLITMIMEKTNSDVSAEEYIKEFRSNM